MSFYVSTGTFVLLHCDEWGRVVALPRHKFVTGATLLQLSPTHYCTGDVVYPIPIKNPIPGIPIDVVAVNYAVFAIRIFINYYL